MANLTPIIAGATAPDCTLDVLDGGTTTLRALHRGKFLVLLFVREFT